VRETKSYQSIEKWQKMRDKQTTTSPVLIIATSLVSGLSHLSLIIGKYLAK